MEEFYEAKQYGKKAPEEMEFALITFFSHLKGEGIKVMEESFFDETKRKEMLSFVELICNLERRENILQQILIFMEYCAREHALICYDEDRSKVANDLVDFANSHIDSSKKKEGVEEQFGEEDSLERETEESREENTKKRKAKESEESEEGQIEKRKRKRRK